MDRDVIVNYLRTQRDLLLSDKSWMVETRKKIQEAFNAAIKAVQMEDFIYQWLGDNFEIPCNHGFKNMQGDDFMHSHCFDWCQMHCGESEKECWAKFFEILKSLEDITR